MIVGLMIILGAAVGLADHVIYASGRNVLWGMTLGALGSCFTCSVITAAYFFKHIGSGDIMNINLYSLFIAIA